ncbi:MAG: cytochrome c oxidase accessory protein CcoG [bacterium]
MTDSVNTETRIPIFQRSVKGKFRNFKFLVLALAYGVYFLLPWIPWERAIGPDQAVLFDIAGRKYYLFGLTVHPQQIFWLAGFLIIAAIFLFFVTAVAGRVFCGYFCFQTLWTDVFMRIEGFIQGERPARIRLHKQPWTAEKFRKVGLTHFLWFLVAFSTAVTFTLYWGEAPVLLKAFFSGTAPAAMYITVAILTATTYAMAGLAREQVCTHMCPYSRFQSAMFDKDTLLVTYDLKRGEGEKGRSTVTKQLKTHEQRQEAGVGDCIDCGYCVQVCPTGIDIRNGLQVQCIHCGLCIDACDTIMDKMGWEKGLIGYRSENQDAGKPTRIIKPKSIGYALTLVIATALLAWSVFSTDDMKATIRQVRQPIYVTLSDGSIQNSYEIKVNNLTAQEKHLTVSIKRFEGATVDLGNIKDVVIHPERQLRLLAKVKHPPFESGEKVTDFNFVVTPDDGSPPIIIPARFYHP